MIQNPSTFRVKTCATSHTPIARLPKAIHTHVPLELGRIPLLQQRITELGRKPKQSVRKDILLHDILRFRHAALHLLARNASLP